MIVGRRTSRSSAQPSLPGVVDRSKPNVARMLLIQLVISRRMEYDDDIVLTLNSLFKMLRSSEIALIAPRVLKLSAKARCTASLDSRSLVLAQLTKGDTSPAKFSQ